MLKQRDINPKTKAALTYALILVAGCLIVITGTALWFISLEPPELPANVATPERSAISPSGNYHLSVIQTVDTDGFPMFTFEISDTNHNVLFRSADEFSTRHTTFFLWTDAFLPRTLLNPCA